MSVIIKDFKIPTGDEPRTFLTHFNDDGTAEMVAVGYPQKQYSLVEVPHGKWNNIIQGIIPSGQCSNCGAWDKVTRFCPNCGSKMGGVSC